MEEDFKEKLDY